MRRASVLILWLLIAACGGGSGGGSNIGVQARVPDVVGLTQAAATSAISSAGLNVGNVTTGSSSTVAAGSVISQNPSANPGSAGEYRNLVVPPGPRDGDGTNVWVRRRPRPRRHHERRLLRATPCRPPAVSSGPRGASSREQCRESGRFVGFQSPFGIDTRPRLANFTLPNQGGGTGSFTLVEPFPNLPNFSNPIFLTGVPAPDTRLVVVEQTGRIKAFAPGAGVSASRIILDVSVTHRIRRRAGIVGARV